MKFQVVLVPDEEDGGFVVSCPALPGCHSQGDTREEALSNIQEAIELVLEFRRDARIPWPDLQLVDCDVNEEVTV